MRIIELGSLNHKIKCSTCGSKLEFDINDVKFKEDTDQEFHQIIECPVCHQMITLTGASAYPESFFTPPEKEG